MLSGCLDKGEKINTAQEKLNEFCQWQPSE